MHVFKVKTCKFLCHTLYICQTFLGTDWLSRDKSGVIKKSVCWANKKGRSFWKFLLRDDILKCTDVTNAELSFGCTTEVGTSF